MPRQKRSERSVVLAAPAVSRIEVTPGEYFETVNHIKCPCCGLMARVEPDEKRRPESRKRIPSLKEGPYHPVFRTQAYGGSLQKNEPGDKRERRIGRMLWEDPREISAEERELLIRNLRQALEHLEDGVVIAPVAKSKKREVK